MPTEDLLRSLDDEPDTPSTVDVRKAMNIGRRRRVRRHAGYAGAAALTVIAVTGTSVAVHLSASGAPLPQPVASRAPRPSASAPAVVTAPSPTGCTVTRLDPPGRVPMALVGGADPTGRYVVGRSYPASGGYQAVIWAGGRGRDVALPGDAETLTDVNSRGDAVGWSYQGQGEDLGPAPYAYTGGKVVRMRGPERAEPRAMNDRGAAVGIATAGRIDRSTGLLWPSPTAEPVPLPVPPGTRATRPSDIGEDGTVVGGLDFTTPVLWTPDGEMRELPRPTLNGKPAAVAQAFSVSDGWATGMATATKTGPGSGGGAGAAIAAVRWNLRTGQVEVVEQLGAPAAAVNRLGWQVGTDRKGYAVLVTDERTIRLPGLGEHRADGTATIVKTISADGRTLAGQSDDKDGVIQAVVWRCR